MLKIFTRTIKKVLRFKNSNKLSMKNCFLSRVIVFLVGLSFSFVSFSQEVIVNGFVFSEDEPNGLIGVNILVLETLTGEVTDFDGNFSLKINQSQLPVSLRFSYTGFDDQEITITKAEPNLRIKMETGGVLMETIEVRGQKIDEKRKSAALTIESLGIREIEQTAANNAYEGLGALKGVDLTSASLGIKVVNTRGFNSTAPVRILQTIDGVDNASPSVNFALGNFLGASDLDLNGVELVVGASSAFYGPNAFNGVIKMTSKDPFFTEGASFNLRVAEQNQQEVEFRWADSYSNKNGHKYLAYKLNASYLRGDDWVANNFASVDSSEVADRKNHYAGYDAVNIYGDEYDSDFDFRNSGQPWNYPGITVFYKEGYKEEVLTSYDTENIKMSGAVHFRTKPELDFDSPVLSASASYAEGKTIFQGATRFRLDGINYLSTKLEYSKRNKYFLRAYMTADGAGNTYNPFVTALKLNELQTDDNNVYRTRYRSVWVDNFGAAARDLGYPELEFVNGTVFYDSEARDAFYNNPTVQDSLQNWHNQTLAILNQQDMFGISPRLQPGTPEFDEATQRINSTLSNSQNFDEGGSKLFTNSKLFHLAGEHIFTPTFLDKITVGGSGRYYTPSTQGTIFDDGLEKVTNYEFGFYGGVEKKFMEDKLTISATGRADKNANFDWIGTPAASIVVKPNDKDYFRFSFSSAIRNPTLPDQYLSLDVGPARFIGNINGVDSLIKIESLKEYLRTAGDETVLEYFDIPAIQPEKVQTFEVGYRSIYFDKLYLDASYYYNRYKQFIGFLEGLDVGGFDLLGLPFDVDAFRVSANSDQTVTTQGAAIGLNLYFKDYYQVSGNYTWSKLITDVDDDIIPAFNTPEHKFNFSLSGRDVPIRIGTFKAPNFGFNINYKWVEGFIFEGSPQFTGFVPSFGLLDVQVNYKFAKQNIKLKIGASNILDNRHYETVGGPLVGRIAYIRLNYQWDKKSNVYGQRKARKDLESIPNN